MARPRSSEVEVETRTRLLQAALQEFARRGRSATRLEDIASAAGIRRASLLHHYSSKDALYAETVHAAFVRLGEALAGAQLPKSQPSERILDHLVSEFSSFVEREPAVARLLLREMIDADEATLRFLLEEIRPLLSHVETRLRKELGDRLRSPATLRQAILQTVVSVLVRHAVGPAIAPLWGERDHSRALARAMIFGDRKDSDK